MGMVSKAYGIAVKVLFIGMSLSMAGCVGCTYVKPGYVGIKVDLYGSQRGVQDYPIVTGRVLYNPWTTQIYDFPTFMQYRVWTASKTEGSMNDESITFVSADKIPVNVDVSAAYRFAAAKVPALFVEFRSDPDTIADTYIRSRIRDAFVREGSKQTAMNIMGGGIAALDTDVRNTVDSEMAPNGIGFDYVSVIGQPRIPVAIQEAINNAIESTQRAQASMNQVAVVKAEADQAVAKAEGEANSVRTVAQGDADAILLKATAQAKANQLLAASLTPELIQLKALERWQGDVPTWQTGAGNTIPFVNIQAPK